MKFFAEKALSWVSVVVMVLLAAIPVTEIFSRIITGSGFPGSIAYMECIVVWVAFLGGIIVTGRDEHLTLVSEEAVPGFFKKIVAAVKDVGGSSFSFAYFVASLSFVLMAFIPGDKVGIFPARLIVSIIPLGFFFMGLFFLLKRGKKGWIIFPLTLALGLLMSLPSVVNLIFFFNPEASFELFALSDAFYEVMRILRWPLVIVIIGLGFAGLPIYLMLGGVAWALFSGAWGALEVLPNEAYNLLTDNMIAAIPLFTFCGFLLAESSSGKRLVRFFRAILGWLPGGLSIVTVLVCAFFTTFTGASGVTILALGGLLYIVMSESGHYSKEFSQGLITSSGSIGLLFPPSLPIILYGVSSQISIIDMFKGGIIPGMILVIALSSMGIFQAVRKKRERIPFDRKEAWEAFKGAFGEILFPVIILVLYFSGITTLAETGAVAVVYTFILLGPVRKELRLKGFANVVERSMAVLGGILMILAMAKGLSYYLVDQSVPQLITSFFENHIHSPIVFLILLNVVLLLTGCLMDIYSAILVVAPLIIPLGNLYGIHPVQIGIIFLANLQLGYLTPPVGLNLFLASYTFKTPLPKIYKTVIPFFVVLLVMVLLITYIPWFSTALL